LPMDLQSGGAFFAPPFFFVGRNRAAGAALQ
jgi:hypothetical protein